MHQVVTYTWCCNITAEILDNLLVGMQAVIKKNPDPAFSIHKLIGRTVQDLIVLSDDTKVQALICEVMVDDFNKKYLFVWGAYAIDGFSHEKTMASLKWAAKETGCEYIEALSQRCGWGKKAKEFGLEVLPMTTYRKYL